MNRIDDETLSRLADCDHEDLCLNDCIRSVCSDSEQRARWARYHLIGEIVQNDFKTPPHHDRPLIGRESIADRVRQALADEPPILAPVTVGNTAHDTTGNAGPDAADDIADDTAHRGSDGKVSSFRPQRNYATGFAVAASAAVLSVFALNWWQNRDSATSPLPTLAEQTPAEQVRESAPAPLLAVSQPQIRLVGHGGTYWVDSDNTQLAEASQSRLNRLLSQHIESSPTNAMQGLLPYSRLVGFDTPANPEADR